MTRDDFDRWGSLVEDLVERFGGTHAAEACALQAFAGGVRNSGGRYEMLTVTTAGDALVAQFARLERGCDPDFRTVVLRGHGIEISGRTNPASRRLFRSDDPLEMRDAVLALHSEPPVRPAWWSVEEGDERVDLVLAPPGSPPGSLRVTVERHGGMLPRLLVRVVDTRIPNGVPVSFVATASETYLKHEQ